MVSTARLRSSHFPHPFEIQKKESQQLIMIQVCFRWGAEAADQEFSEH